MKHCNPRRLISLVLAFVMVFGLLPTGFANAQENHVAAVSEVYEAPESLAPKGTAFNIDELLAWTPESDPDAAYSRASIPLADRQGGFQVNPLSNPEAKLMLCAMNDNPMAQGSESMLSYAFNYWQYVDSYIYWGGNGEGFIQAPTGEIIDAAHTNGVPIVGVLGFPWGSGYGYVEQVDAFCQKAADGSFPVADKLIEVMDYYGFDGWFFNQESYGCSREIAARLNEMMRYMHAKRPDIVISWYDSMVESGGVSYQDAVNDTNKFWMTADENGNWGVDEFFMNYNWSASKVNTTINTMKSIGRSQYDAFAGFNMQSNVYGDQLRDHLLVDEDGVAKLSLALYYSGQTQTVAKDAVDFHRTELGYYVGGAGDPRDTSVDVANPSVTTWPGMSRLFADKSPITSAPFVTDFNTGHGKYWFVDGEKLRDSEWSYQSNQDVLPTYTWIIDSNGEQKLEGSYDFEDAYNGGSSIKFSGTIDASNMIKLFSTNVEITDGMTVNMTAKGGLEDAYLVVYVGDADAESYMDCDRISCMFEGTEGWSTAEAILGAYAGKTIHSIGLDIDGAQTDYEINVGRVSIIDKDRNAVNGPKDLRLDAIAYTDPYTAEARIRWSKVTGASSYEIYKVHADGSKSFIMETPNTAYYIPNLTRDADETDVTIEVVPVNRNGERGKASELVIDWAYDNEDGDRVVKSDSVNVCLGATVTGYSEQGDGAECDKAIDGVSGNGSKWWASGNGDWFSIDLGEPKAIKRIRVEHAEAGGEGKDLNTNTFTVYFKDSESNAWVQAYKKSGNTDAVTDDVLDDAITAQEWKIEINRIGPSPWSAVNIYEWQMFETGFPATEPVAMRYASAFNGEGANDTFTLTNIPASYTVKVYNAEAEVIGETTGSGSVELTGLDFGTSEAGRVYYTVTAAGYGESVKFSASFEAENAAKSEPATDVKFVNYSQPGSVSSSSGDDIYTTMTVSGLAEGDVVYVLGAEPKASIPVAAGETSVSIEGVRVVRAGGELALQVKRVGSLISDVYNVETPAFDEPTATIQVFAVNEAGETLTGVRFEILDEEGNVASQMSTTSDSGAKSEVALGTYTISNTESPEGYGLAEDFTAIVRIEGWQSVYEVTVPAAGEEPDPSEPDEEVDPTDDSRDIPVSVLTATAGDYEKNGGASEGPPELVLDDDYNTLWHTDWKGTSRENHWIQFALSEDYNVDGLRYKPRGGGSTNGTITEYDILVSDDGETFRSVATGSWAADSNWKIAQFYGENVKYVRLVSKNAVSDNSWVFASAAEIRLTGRTAELSNADKSALDALIEVCEQIEQGNYTAKSWQDFQKALEKAKTVSADPYASQTKVDEALQKLTEAYMGLEEKVEGEGIQKILHLDSGRKFFSKDFTIALLNEMSAAGYTHLQLAFGNNGFRFVLDDMTIEANDTTYASEDVKAGIELGNRNYHDEGEQNALTEAEMDEILAHAQRVGIQIIPHLNMPGHMNALLDAMEYVGISDAHFTGYTESASSVNLNNQEALNFMMALVDKYAKYFSDAGCKYFHIGADEYANDAYNGNMGFPNMGANLYEKFAGFVNGTAAIVKGYGMTPRAWNDGVYYGNYTAEFDSDIEITYWSAGWWGYNLAKASKFVELGHGLINTDGGYYFILGKDDTFTTGNTVGHTPGTYLPAESYEVTRFSDGTTVEEPVGGMFCIWADYPDAETEQEVAANIRLALRAMALRMEDLDLDGMNTDVVAGGFNEDGTINGEVVEPTTYAITIGQVENGTVTADKTEAAEDEIITVTATPAEGYKLSAIYVNGIAIEGNTFQMPGREVVITAEFVSDGSGAVDEETIRAAEEAAAAAEAAQKAAEEAQRKAEEAQAAAEEAAASAAEDKTAAEAARKEAEEAVAAAEAAQKAAEDAQAAAEEAQAAAEAHDAAAALAAAEAAKHAQEVAELNAEIAAMKAEMAEYLNDAQKAAEEAEEHNKAAAAAALSAAKYEALIELALYIDPDDYDAATAALIEEAMNAGIEAINAAETIEAVREALEAVLAEIDELAVHMPFVDVPSDSFYFAAVKWALKNQITTGTDATHFTPNKSITRAEAITFLWRAAGSPEPAATASPFVDVKESDFFFKAVLWAIEEGITTGLDQNHFGPYATANRAQVVTFLWRANGSPIASAENPFTDVSEKAWFHDAVLWALEEGVTTGVSNTFFDAWGSCNRAQVVTFLYRASK